MNPTDRKTLIQTIIGGMCALGLIVLGYFSLDPSLTLTWPVAGAIVVVIAMLLGKLEKLTDLVYAWTQRYGAYQPDRDRDDE